MKERVRAICGSLSDKCNIGTFHSVCGKMLRIKGISIGIAKDYSILGEKDKDCVVREICSQLGIEDELPVSQILHVISEAKNSAKNPRQFAADAKKMKDQTYSNIIAPFYLKYEELVRQRTSLRTGQNLRHRLALYK